MRLRTGFFILLGLACLAFLLSAEKSADSPQIHKVVQTETPALSAPLKRPATALSSGRTPAAVGKNADSPALPFDEIVRLISEDRECDSGGDSLSIPNSLPREVSYAALLKASTPDAKPDPCILALEAGRREDLLRLTENQDASTCVFLRALTLTGQMEFPAGPAINVSETEQGLTLLTLLAERDAGNGVYPFFKIGPLMGLGRSDDATASLTEFLHSDKMENPLRSLVLDIAALGALNPTAFLHSQGLANASGMPSYRASAQAAKALISGQNPEDAIAWAQLWEGKMQQMEGSKFHELFPLMTEVATMRMLAKAAWELHASNAPLPRLLQDEPWHQLFQSLAVDDDLDWVLSDQDRCRDYYEAARRILPLYRAKLHANR